MNLEAIDLFVQTKYLHQELAGARIQKIYMPTPTSLLLQCHKEKTLPLLCDLGQNGPALYLPKELPQTPDSPLNFCMLLRKHLEGGHIVRLEQKNFDRIIEMTVNAPIPGDKTTPKVLVFELMGRSNNIILRQDEKTLGSLRKIHAIPAEQKGLHPLAVEAVKLAQAIQANPAPNLKQKITSTLLGIGSHTAEILAQAEDLTTALRELQDKYSKPADSRINDLIIEKITASPLQLDLQKNLQGIIKGEINKNAKKLQALTEELATAENAEEYRIKADTLMSNLPKIKKGQASITLPNLYDGETLTIALNPSFTPAENAQQYYKRYNKYQRAQKELAKQISLTKDELEYLDSIETALSLPLKRNEIEEINQELINAGILKKKKNKGQHTPPSEPLKITLPDAVIYIGRNNRQNDYLTFKLAKPTDLWFHTKDIPGSHVILCGEQTEKNIQLAMQYAAYYSKARNSSNVPVDMVLKKFVKKPNGAKPGFVIFTNNRTSYVEPVGEINN